MANKNIKDWVLGDPKLISELTKAERKFLGRKVLNSTLKNAPDGMRIGFDGTLHFTDGSVATRTGKGRGKNSQYNFTSADGKFITNKSNGKAFTPKQILASAEDGTDSKAYLQAVDQYRKDRNIGKYRKPPTAGKAVRVSTGESWDEKMKRESLKPSALDRVRSLAADQSFPVAKGIASTVGSIARLKDQYEKDGAVPILEDIGNSTMSTLAAPFSASSSQWWKNRLNNRSGEANNIGKNIANEAMLGVVGGMAGKAIGTAYKGAKRGAEMYNHRIKNLAKQAEQKALGDKNFIKKIRGEFDLDRYIAKVNGEPVPKLFNLGQQLKDKAALLRQRTYEDLTSVPPRKSYLRAVTGEPDLIRRSTVGDVGYSQKLSAIDKLKKTYRDNTIGVHGGTANKDASTVFEFTSPTHRDPTITRLADAVGHNIKRKFGNRGMLESNNIELNRLYQQTNDLNKARKAQRNAWDEIPTEWMNTGAMIGVASGM